MGRKKKNQLLPRNLGSVKKVSARQLELVIADWGDNKLVLHVGSI